MSQTYDARVTMSLPQINRLRATRDRYEAALWVARQVVTEWEKQPMREMLASMDRAVDALREALAAAQEDTP
jgi:hypothetical protein